MGTEAVKAFRRTWEPRAKRASRPTPPKQGGESARASEASRSSGRGYEPPQGRASAVTTTGAVPRVSAATPLPRPSEAALRVQAQGSAQVRRSSGIRVKPELASREALVPAAPTPEEVPTQPGRRRGSAPELRTRTSAERLKFQPEFVAPSAPQSGGSVQRTFVAPNKRHAREPTDHDVQILSVYAPPPLPVRRQEPLGFADVDASEIEILVEDTRQATDAILETQVIPFVEDRAPSRLRRSLVMVGVLALSAVAGGTAYTFAPKLAGLLRFPASVATVSDASKPLPTPVARPTQTVATPAVPSSARAPEVQVLTLQEEVLAEPSEAAPPSAPAAGSVELLAPAALDTSAPEAVETSEGKVISRAKHKKARRLRARQRRARLRARAASADGVAAPEK